MAIFRTTRPRIVVLGVGGAGGNAINNLAAADLGDVDLVAVNTDMQALASSKAEHRIQLGPSLTEGMGAGARPEIGEAAAEEAIDEIAARAFGAHLVFIAAGMGGGTGTGAAHVVARVAKDLGVLVVGVVTMPFHFEGSVRMRNAEAGLAALRQNVDTLLVIPNENLFRVSTEKTTISEAFLMADEVLYSGVACIIDLIFKDGLIDLDFADVKTVLGGMGTAMIGSGEADGEQRALTAAEAAIFNPLLDEVSLKGTRNLLLSISGGADLTLWEVDEAANRVRREVDANANIIVGANLDEDLGEKIRVSIVASGMPRPSVALTAGEVEKPGWIPRSQRALASPAPVADSYGRRLAEAIGDGGAKSKARASRRTGAAERREPVEPTTGPDEATPAQCVPGPAARPRRSAAGRKGALINGGADGKSARAEGGRRASRKSAQPEAVVRGRPEFWAAQIGGEAGSTSAVDQAGAGGSWSEAPPQGDAPVPVAAMIAPPPALDQSASKAPAPSPAQNGEARATVPSQDRGCLSTIEARLSAPELPMPPREADRAGEARLTFVAPRLAHFDGRTLEARAFGAGETGDDLEGGTSLAAGEAGRPRMAELSVAIQYEHSTRQRESNLLSRLASLVRTRREM